MGTLLAAAVGMNPGVVGAESTVTRVILGTEFTQLGPEYPRTNPPR